MYASCFRYMAPFDEAAEQEVPNWDFAMSLANKGHMVDKYTVKGSQFQQPLMEFSGACSGCGETPYVKLVTQLYGDRMVIANASGCSSVWGGTATTNPYTVNDEGKGPAWGRSLFEDNAEFGYGMALITEGLLLRPMLMTELVTDYLIPLLLWMLQVPPPLPQETGLSQCGEICSPVLQRST